MLQGARFGEQHMSRALRELYLSLHSMQISEAQSIAKMPSFSGQQRMSNYYRQSIFTSLFFIPFQAWIEKSQSELQYVYKHVANRAFIIFSCTSSKAKQEVGVLFKTNLIGIGTQHDKRALWRRPNCPRIASTGRTS